jgi:hypothetical protein
MTTRWLQVAHHLAERTRLYSPVLRRNDAACEHAAPGRFVATTGDHRDLESLPPNTTPTASAAQSKRKLRAKRFPWHEAKGHRRPPANPRSKTT